MELTERWFNAYAKSKVDSAATLEEKRFIRWHWRCYLYELRQFCSIMAGRPLHSVLDIGPGNFFFADAVTELHPRTVYECVEPDSAMHGTGLFQTSTARRQYRVYSANLEHDLTLESRYDAVVCFDVVEHLLHNPSMFLYNVHRLLTDTGVFFLITDNVMRLISIVKLLIGMNIYFPLLEPYYVRHNREYTFREAKDLLEGTGFRILKGSRFNFTVYWPSRLQTAIYSLLNLISEIPPLTRYKCHMFFACEKAGAPRLYRPAWLYEHSYGWGVVLDRKSRKGSERDAHETHCR